MFVCACNFVKTGKLLMNGDLKAKMVFIHFSLNFMYFTARVFKLLHWNKFTEDQCQTVRINKKI